MDQLLTIIELALSGASLLLIAYHVVSQKRTASKPKLTKKEKLQKKIDKMD